MPASTNLGTVHVSLDLRLQKLKDGVRDGKRELHSLEGSLKKTADAFASVGRKMTIGLTLPLVALGKGAVETAVRFDSLKRGLVAVEGSSEAAEKSLKRLKEVAKLPGLGLEEAQEGYIRLRAVKLNADLAERSLMAFGNALASVGRGKAELDGINLALTQIVGKGKVTAEEINQIAERLPQVRELMKQAFGTADTEVLQKRGLAPEEFISGIVTQLEKLPKVTGGAQNAFENFSDSVKIFQQSLGNALLPTLTRAMDALSPKLEAATKWFNSLGDAGKDAFAGIALTLAVGGPLMIGIAGLINALKTIHALFVGIAASSAFKWMAGFLGTTAGAGAVAVGGAAALNFLPRVFSGSSTPGGAGRTSAMDAANIAGSEGIPSWALPKGQTADQLFGGFMKTAKARALPGGKPPAVPSKVRDSSGRELLTANLDALADLGSEEAQIMREAQRMRNRGIKESTVQMFIRQKMAPLLRKRQEIMMGNVLRGGHEEVRNLPSATGSIPSLSSLKDMPFGGEGPWQKFGNWLQNKPANAAPEGQSMSIFSWAAMGAGMAPKSPKPRDIEKASLPGIKEISFNLGQELGNNLAMEMGRSFQDMFDKVFGTGNPLSRALSRTLGRLVDDVVYALAQKAFGQNLILSILGGGGGLFGGGGGTSTVAGAMGFGATAAGPPVFKAAGAKAGAAYGTTFALNALAVIGGAFAASRILNSIFPGSPQGRSNLRQQYSLNPGMSASAFGLGGARFSGTPYAVNFYGSNFNNDQDPRRVADSLAWHVNQRMASRPGNA